MLLHRRQHFGRGRSQHPLQGIDIGEPHVAERWEAPVPPEAELPTLRLADGTTLVKPQPRELAERLGLQTVPTLKLYDTAMIGGGPAGLAAAVYGASEGLRTLVI
jgi:thioredoxin reductase (NADPH)